MTRDEVLQELESMRNEKTAAHNIKYGATNTFGVKLGDIRTLAKKIKINKPLAVELWNSGNADAQLLACLIAEPKSMSADELDKMVASTNFSGVADWFNAYLLKDHPQREELRQKWLKSNDKWAQRSAWSITSGRIARNSDGLDLGQMLGHLEIEMPKAHPEVQWTMNFALAYIGIHHPHLRQRALAIGEKLGLYRDFPVSKGCTSPFAPIWINEMVNRQSK